MGFDRLIKAIDKTKNPTVAGLDPKLEYIPWHIKKEAFTEYGETLEGAAEAVFQFNKGLIDALYDIVPAIKPQAAYYEMYGWPGVRALAMTIEYAKGKGMFVITDGKRNDIGSTMEAYATAHLGKTDVGKNKMAAFNADALTVNGYLGTDGIAPLLDICTQDDKGIFVLVKTSNPSSGELQDLLLSNDGKTVYHQMGIMCERWGENSRGEFGYSAVGAVVGATYPSQLAYLRSAMPHTFFLVPGYGAQGGSGDDIVGAFDGDGRGGVVNASRSLMCAWSNEAVRNDVDISSDVAQSEYGLRFGEWARIEAVKMKEDVSRIL